MPGTSIRAAVCRQFGAPLNIETLTLAPPTAREAQVKLHAVSICHSDITYMDGGWGGSPPIVFGHEGAGVVVAVGDRADVAVGDRVIVTLLRSCGACSPCCRGAPTQCEYAFDPKTRLTDADGAPVAVGLKTGAFADQVVVDSSQVAVMEDDLPFEQACLLACGVLTGWGAAANAAPIAAGDAVAVVGCGGVGVNCLQAAAALGASPLVAIDVSAKKLKLARQFGATHTVAVDEDARAITGGRGFDVVLMAAGNAKAAEHAATLTAKLGTLALVGMPPVGDLARLDILSIADNQQRVIGTKLGNVRLREAISELFKQRRQGCLQLAPLIAGRHPFEDINRALDIARRGDALRQILTFPAA